MIKAITLWQPYASLIALGLKRYETRSWYTSHRGLLAIHASKRWTREEIAVTDYLGGNFSEIFNALDYPLPLGAVLCVCNIISCYPTNNLQPNRLERLCGDFSPGRFAWKLEVVKVFDQPIPAVGKQGLWDWQPSI